MRLAYKIALGLFVVGYGTALLANPAAYYLAGICFTASMSIALLSFLNGDAK